MTTRDKRTHLHSVDEITDMMRGRIRELCEVWELDGLVEGRDFVAFNPLRSDSSRGSFRVCLSGPYQGLVKDFAGDKPYSPLSFTAELWFNGDNVQAIKWAKGWLGLDGTNPDSLKKSRVAQERRAGERSADDEADALKRRNWAYRIYLEATPLYDADDQLMGSPVELYLRGRGIELARLPFPLRSLRFHPSLFHKVADRRFPAMVAAINGPEGQFMGVHRTWLERQSDGRVTKAPLDAKQNKKCLGPYQGGMIRLWGGTRVNPETGEILPAVKLGILAKKIEQGKDVALADLDITEGIEDGASVACAMPELRVGVGVSISNMTGLKYPPAVGTVVFWKQNDAAGSEADRAFGNVVANAVRQGKQVRLAAPAEGFKDPNEILQRFGQERSA
jgi:hypothetical protein